MIFNVYLFKVQWDYIEKPQSIQDEEGLRAGNKITKAHLNLQNKREKVRLVVQALSASVAFSLDCMKRIGHVHFLRSEETSSWLMDIDRYFICFPKKSH